MERIPQVIVTTTRDGIVESMHTGDVVVARPDGEVTAVVGDPSRPIYPRSALKPIQALAILDQLADLGITIGEDQVAVMCASHDGGDDPQVAAASLLADAGLDESALRCPPDWPIDDDVAATLDGRTALSHNCSGKHAGMLLAHTAAGHDPGTYLAVDSVLQRRVARWLATITDEEPGGPGVDGCGAPAWRVSLGGLAIAFARVLEGRTSTIARVRDAMLAHPQLVGGRSLPDTALMLADVRVLAKRGAEGVMACGFWHVDHGPLGVAVKITDGGDRAAGPAAAAVLEALGAQVPDEVRRAPVLGGGQPHGVVEATGPLSRATTEAFGLA